MVLYKHFYCVRTHSASHLRPSSLLSLLSLISIVIEQGISLLPLLLLWYIRCDHDWTIKVQYNRMSIADRSYHSSEIWCVYPRFASAVVRA